MSKVTKPIALDETLQRVATALETMSGSGIIDDTAGSGDTDKVWSADKVVSELADKYEKPSGGIPGSDLASGVLTSIIDDTAGSGEANKVWSADKSSTLQSAIDQKAQIIVAKAEGETIRIRDGADNRSVISMIANIIPIQSGSGTPSTSNIRPISGITGMNVYHSGADISDKDTYTYSWEDNGAIYLGYINLLTGKLVKTGIVLTFNGNETWNEGGYNASNKYRYSTSVGSYGIAKGANRQDIVACNMFKPVQNGSTSTAAFGTEIICMASGSNSLMIATNIATTASAFKTYLSSNNLVVVGVLATPVEVMTFTAEEIRTIIGENNIWSDYADVSVEYYADTKLYADRQDMTEEISFAEYSGYFASDGSIEDAGNQNEKHTDRFDLSLFDGSITISLDYTQSRSMWIAVCKFRKDGSYIDRTVLISESKKSYSEIISADDNVAYVSFAYRKYSDGVFKIVGKPSRTGVLYAENKNGEIIDNIRTYNIITKPCYDHLYVENTGSNITIPHESLFHVRTSRAMGFNVIEANINHTSDGVYVVNHFDSGKFSGFFHHVDGVTDISDTLITSVTWDWVVTNVRYNSSITKYQTRPARLEEFLSECKQQGIIPFIYGKDANVVALADKYMGKNNYIVYGGNRNACPNAVIYQWISKNTKAQIVAECEKYGRPFIYGMANPTNFTDEQLMDIVNELHKRGYWIGVSYCDEKWHKYSYMGFDIIGTLGRINRINNGNICNLSTIAGFSSFTFSNATETNGVLTFSSAGTITPNIDDTSYDMCGFDLQMEYTGTITVPSVGEHRTSRVYTSDGTMPLFICVPIINGSPKITLNVSSGTVISDMQFKASKFC